MPIITRPRTRGYETVVFARQRAHAYTRERDRLAHIFPTTTRTRARVVFICIICVISERLQSASGAVTVQIRALPCSMIEERTERENVGAGCFCARLRVRIMRPRESGERYHIFTNEKV